MRAHTLMDSPIGVLTLVGTDGVLNAVYMQEHKHRPDASTFGPRRDAVLAQAAQELDEYFCGSRTEFTMPTQAEGSEFQQRVWAGLRTIPYGQTWSYTRLTAAVVGGEASHTSVRAVAAANGRNPLSIVVPCHRVVGSDGSLTGFAGGLRRKRFLLDLETPADVRAGQLF